MLIFLWYPGISMYLFRWFHLTFSPVSPWDDSRRRWKKQVGSAHPERAIWREIDYQPATPGGNGIDVRNVNESSDIAWFVDPQMMELDGIGRFIYLVDSFLMWGLQ